PGAVLHEIEPRIVGTPAPDGRVARAPAVAGPAARAEVGAAHVGRLELTRAGQHLGVRSDVARGPVDAPTGQIETLHPAVDAELPAGSPADAPVLPPHRPQGR